MLLGDCLASAHATACSGTCLKVCFYFAKQQNEGKQENPQLNTGIFVINCSTSPLEICPARTHEWTLESFYLIKILTGSFTSKLQEGQHRQLCLPGVSEQVHLSMPWRASKGWRSEKAQTQDRALSKAGQSPQHRNAPVIPQALIMALLVFILFSKSSGTPGKSHPQLFSVSLFCGLSENLSSQMGPRGYNSTNFPITAKLSKHCTSFHSLLNFCNCLPTWLPVWLLHSNYRQHHSQVSHSPSISPV